MALGSQEPSPQDRQGASPGDAPRSSWFGSTTRALNIFGTLLILAVLLAVNADVIGRNVFNRPLPGVLEFIGLAIVAIVFLQMANTLREDRHLANDILMRLVDRAWPRFAAALHTIFYLIGALLMVLIVWFVWPILRDNFLGGYYRGTAEVIEIPIWPFDAAVVVGAAATAIQFLLLAWRAFGRASGRNPA
jgi:TRAP-type C4-dicarboxylate transport system permease small subunit